MFRWGFIGSKGIAITVANEVVKNKGIMISAVYSKNLDHAKDFAKKYNCIPYGSFDKMIADRAFDALYIATPHRHHYHYAKIALEHNIPVLCEKTLTLHEDSAKELFEIAKANNTYFAEAMWTWFNPVANKVKEWVDANKIGQIYEFRGDFSIPSIVAPKIRLRDVSLGGGSLFDLGVYPVTYAYRLFGYPDEIHAKAFMKNGCDYTCKVTFKYNSGLTCNLTSGFLTFGKNDIKITGTNGLIRVPSFFHASRKAKLLNKNPETFRDQEEIGLYEREFAIASKEIMEGKIVSSYVSDEDTLTVMKILEEVKRQINLSYPNDKD